MVVTILMRQAQKSLNWNPNRIRKTNIMIKAVAMINIEANHFKHYNIVDSRMSLCPQDPCRRPSRHVVSWWVEGYAEGGSNKIGDGGRGKGYILIRVD